MTIGNLNVTYQAYMVKVSEYIDEHGKSPYAEWHDHLDARAAADGERVVIILGGGTKKRQQRDINAAKTYWQDYKARKRKSK